MKYRGLDVQSGIKKWCFVPQNKGLCDAQLGSCDVSGTSQDEDGLILAYAAKLRNKIFYN
jgi:hypothetical protein